MRFPNYANQELQNIPAICMNVGPMLNGYDKSTLVGSGAVLWKGREMYAAGEIDEHEFMDYISRRYVSDTPSDSFSANEKLTDLD